jgi:hypothetical protein
MLRRQVLKNLVERNPDLDTRLGHDAVTHRLGQRAQEIFERDLHVATGELWIDQIEGKRHPLARWRRDTAAQDASRQEPENRQEPQGNGFAHRRSRLGHLGWSGGFGKVSRP